MSEPVIRLQVTGFANGGAGVARDAEGRVVFVAGALPGEQVLARLHEEKARFATAQAIEILEPSQHRIDPLCPAAAAGAGCCDLSFATPDYAARLRSAALADVLARIGGFDADDRSGPTVAELDADPTRWRVRTRLAVGSTGAVGLRAHGSAEVITEPCAGPVAGLLDGVEQLAATPGAELVLAMDSESCRHIVELAAVDTPGRPRGSGRGAAQRARQRRSVPRRTRTLEGDDFAVQRIGGRRWRIPVTGFWQAHRNAPHAYAETVREFTARAVPGPGPLRVWDLYGGAGVLGAALLDGADAGGPAVAGIDLVETAPGALEAARETFADDPVELHRGDVATVISGLPRPDVVLVDPPRRGAGAAVVAAIAAARPRAVVHIGCDAGAFARDLRDYTAQGFRVTDWRAYDAFPLTHHVEAIALLQSP